MRIPLRPAVTSVGALLLALVPLLLLGGTDRTTGFRLAVLLLGGFALRAISRWTATTHAAPLDSPFARPRGTTVPLRHRLRRRSPPRTTTLDALVLGAAERAGPFHFRLRPALRDIADERLQARHGLTIDDPRARALLGRDAWDHLRADRPPPDDRRAPGPDRATLATILDALETL